MCRLQIRALLSFKMILMMNSFNMMTSCLGPGVAALSDQLTITDIETLKLHCMHTPISITS